MMHDLLFEIGCEELPSKAVLTLAKALAQQFSDRLQKAQLVFKEIHFFATPRRLAVHIKDLIDKQPTQKLVRKGPAISAALDKDGKPQASLLGFIKSCETHLEALSILKNEQGSWYTYEKEIPGADTASLLPQIVAEAVAALPIAKPMRWSSETYAFVRPVHWIILLLDEQPLPITLFGIKSDQYTYGHRFHAPQALFVPHAKHYEALLEKAYVIADYEKRRHIIQQQIITIAESGQGKAIVPEALLDEVSAIVEWPHSMLAHFDAHFLNIPGEALITAMQQHQKCFALCDTQNQLLPAFVVVSNIESIQEQQVILGNEKVMRARLSDAQFFYQQDKKSPLEHHISATARVVFHQRLGSLLEKTQRIEVLMQFIQSFFNILPEDAIRVAQLSKCDLMTNMVGEFPELQGLMGYYYATHDQEKETVAKALYEQYLPRFAGDMLPETALGTTLSLTDRMDTLAGIFAIGEKPTGDKDPFKLRRHALAIVRILSTTPVSLALSDLIRKALENYSGLITSDSLVQELHAFILERLQSFYQAQGFSVDCITAVRLCEQEHLFDIAQRLQALAHFITLPAAQALANACKRVNNVLSKAPQETFLFNPALLQTIEETHLLKELVEIEEIINADLLTPSYKDILCRLAELRTPIDDFFAQVMVMVDDVPLRNNRLALLQRLQTTMRYVADIAQLSLN